MLPARILPTLLTILALLTAPLAAQEGVSGGGVTVKQDGDFLVLIPDDPGKTYLILGYPREADAKGGSTGEITALTDGRRLPAKPFSKLVFVELRPVSEVILKAGSTGGLQLTSNPCNSGACEKPFPLECPPICPFLYLMDDPRVQNMPQHPK